MEGRYSKVTIREKQESVTVKISNKLKPEIISTVIEKWQSLIDVIAKIIDVPSGLIMKLNEDTIEVFLRSNTKNNPYEKGEKAELIYGLYCETVIGTQKRLLVPDASKDPVWKDNNPDVKINMISYLGFPVNWPDGEVFGTVCLLDNKENHYSHIYNDLLYQVKQHIETDLKLLCNNEELNEKSEQLEHLNNTKSRFLSLISHDIRGSIGTIDKLLKLIISNFNEFNTSKLNHMLKSLSESTSSAYLTLEGLLDWSKTDLLHIEPNKNKFNLIELFNRILDYFEPLIAFKEIDLTKDFRPGEAEVFADVKMMETSFRNILSNAIKYSDMKGKIFIRIFKENSKNIIEIEDTGIGMKEDTINALFIYDQSQNKEGTHKESSSGIGLLIAKDFLDKNNATVQVFSELNKGTKFAISL